MAMQIALVVKDDYQADIKSLSLLANAAGFALRRNGYQPGMALDGMVSDVLAVDVIGSSHDDLAAKLATLEEYFERAGWAKESAERYFVWLRAQMTNETGARQALVMGGSHGDKAGFYSPPASPGNRLVNYPIVVDRLPEWENIAATTTVAEDSISTVGGKGIISGITAESLGNYTDGPSHNIPYVHVVDHSPVNPCSCVLHYTHDSVAQTATADSAGDFTGTGLTSTTINYTTGQLTIFGPDDDTEITLDYSAQAGDGPARIGCTILSAATTLKELWWGFRTSRHGTLSNFVSPWEVGSGTSGTDTGSDVDDETASGGHKRICTFATTAAEAKRWSITPYQISNANYNDQRGTFQIVARLKVDTGFSVLVRLVSGISTALTYNDQVSVTATDWTLYDLGRLTLPAGGSSTYLYSLMRNSLIALYATWVAGSLEASHGLHMDCLIPIPVDEGYAHVNNMTDPISYLMIDPLGRISCLGMTTGEFTGLGDSPGTNVKDYKLPKNAGMVIMAAQRSTGSTLADTVSMTLKYFPRWRTLRGAG